MRTRAAPTPPRRLARVAIATTASLPWLTGTSINPLLRAEQLARRGIAVRLLVPWIEPRQQGAVFPPTLRFATAWHQLEYVRDWLVREAGGCSLDLATYPARFVPSLQSIFPIGDPLATLRERPDLVVLEEPEHLFLATPWHAIAARARHRTLGIVHTNYPYYLSTQVAPRMPRVARLYARYGNWLMARSSHAVVRLSAALPGPRGVLTDNLNGVRARFFAGPRSDARAGAYFVGKLLWAKGFAALIELCAASGLTAVDVFGAGPDASAIHASAAARGIALTLRGPTLDPARELAGYRVFLNPSTSEGVATTTLEALALGQWVIVPAHPSNAFAAGFTGCLSYDSARAQQRAVAHALATPPPEPSPAERHRLTWEAATERLLEVVERRFGLALAGGHTNG